MTDWPIYFKERLSLINPENGYVGVATLWTPKEKLVSLIDEAPSTLLSGYLLPLLRRERNPSEAENSSHSSASLPASPDASQGGRSRFSAKGDKNVSVVGQLYSKAGIEFIIRNLWANPKVSCLVVCGEDLTKSGNALIEFFEKGTIDGHKFLFGNLIPSEDLENIRNNVKLVDLRKEKNLGNIAKKIKEIKRCSPFAKDPKFFPQPIIPGNFPSETSTIRIESLTIGITWLQILRTILRFGWEIPRIFVYGGKERMVLNLVAIVTDEDIREPKLYPFFNFGKVELKNYVKDFFTPKRGDQAYTYGERLFDYLKVDQLKIMVQKLREFPYNKGALAVLWQPSIDNFPKRNPWRTPCLTLVQGICQKDKLHLTAYFRSNDMFGAWPQNAFALRKLQTVLADKIGKKVGHLTTISQSAFIDGNDLPAVKKIVESSEQFFCQWDPRGNLVISVEGNEIIAKHFSPEGIFLEEFRVDGKAPKAAQKMIQVLISNQIISRVEHALDIGEQLGRAEDAIKMGFKFEQDRSLAK